MIRSRSNPHFQERPESGASRHPESSRRQARRLIKQNRQSRFRRSPDVRPPARQRPRSVRKPTPRDRVSPIAAPPPAGKSCPPPKATQSLFRLPQSRPPHFRRRRLPHPPKTRPPRISAP